MTTTTPPTSVRFDLRSIPGLVPPSMVTPLDDLSPGGLPQVVLPTGHTAVHLTAYPDVQKILTDTSFIRSDTNVDDGPSFLPTVMPEEMLLNLDHPHHGRLKRFVAAAYSANTMAAFAPTVRQIVSDAADALTPASSFDLMTDLLEPLTINVNATYLGVPDDDIPGFRHLSRQMQLAHDTDIPQLLEDFWELYHYLEDLIAGRRPLNDGLIKNLLAAREEATPPVTDGEYAALLLGSLVGGDQNVLSELSKIVFVALSHHELWELMSTNPDSIPAVTEELLRLLPLGRISTFPRIASRDVAVSGGTVREGETVYADAHAANRDPLVYPEPWIVDTSRTAKRHLQFGYGMHHCMGAAMARMEIHETLAVLTSTLPDLTLETPADGVQWDTGVLVHRPLSLPVTTGK